MLKANNVTTPDRLNARGRRGTQASDAYINHILTQIDEQTAKTLKEQQRQQIKDVLQQSGLIQRHAIDVRVSVPLYFMKFYLVFFIGRDTRDVTKLKEKARAFLGKTLGGLFLFYLSLCIFLPGIFFVLYLIKSWLGIDIFPDRHLADFF